MASAKCCWVRRNSAVEYVRSMSIKRKAIAFDALQKCQEADPVGCENWFMPAIGMTVGDFAACWALTNVESEKIHTARTIYQQRWRQQLEREHENLVRNNETALLSSSLPSPAVDTEDPNDHGSHKKQRIHLDQELHPITDIVRATNATKKWSIQPWTFTANTTKSRTDKQPVVSTTNFIPAAFCRTSAKRKIDNNTVSSSSTCSEQNNGAACDGNGNSYGNVGYPSPSEFCGTEAAQKTQENSLGQIQS